MAIDIANLTKLLTILRNDLKLSKNGAFEYIDLIVRELLASKTKKNTKELLMQIKSSGKMIDYANFTTQQEEMWNDIWREVTRILHNS